MIKIKFIMGCMAYFLAVPFVASAQITSVNNVQDLNFGTFATGPTGGSITIANDGTRSITGSVTGLGGEAYFQSIFEILAPKNSIIGISNGPDINLTGSNGGTMIFHIGVSNLGLQFQTEAEPPLPTQVKIGGTLTVRDISSNPSGNYSGTFLVTFNNE